MATLSILAKAIRVKISLFHPIKNRKDYGFGSRDFFLALTNGHESTLGVLIG